MSLSVYKDHSFLVFQQDDKICKYDFATKTTYGWSGKKVKSLQSQLRGISIAQVIDGCVDTNYGLFLNKVKFWMSSQGTYISNIGTILTYVPSFSNLEQYFSAGLTNVEKDMNKVPFSDVPKGLMKICKSKNYPLSYSVYETYKKHPDIFNFVVSEHYETLTFKNIVEYILDYQWSYRETKTAYEMFLEHKYNPKSLFKYIDDLMTYEACGISVIRELLDYANMMSKISPKFDKYPRHFLTTHAIACRNYNRLKQQFQEDSFQAKVDLTLEDKIGDYIFIYPKTTQDIKDEAVQQNNCVASYISRVIDGQCHILFMRDSSEPDKSLVTLEVVDNVIVQAKQRFNYDVTPKQRAAIETWNKKHKAISA